MFTPDPPDQPSMPELATALAKLLTAAAAIGFPMPRYVTLSDNLRISLQLPAELDSLIAILSWASAFSGTVDIDCGQGENGPEISAATQFIFGNAKIWVYALIQLR